MKINLHHLFIFLSILLLQACFEGETVTGTITNTNGEPIIDAQVSASYSSDTLETLTNTAGQYSFTHPANTGEVTITVQKSDYESQTKTVAITDADITLDFILQPAVTIETGHISGTITDFAGQPLENVQVFSNQATALTNAQGQYNLTIPVSEQVSISASLENFVINSRNIAVEKEQTAQLDMMLAQVDRIETFDVATGASITTKGATVVLPADSIINNDNTTYTGLVTAKVSFNQVTSSVGRAAFPGDYIGVGTDGEPSVLQSYGFIDVTLEDSNGNALKMAEGATATLTYPADHNLTDRPATIPLWYYDIESGQWLEEGSANYDEATQTYTGEVSHFTTWNLDVKVARAHFNGCVEDVNGMRIPDAVIHLTTPGWNRSFQNNDPDGEFSFVNAPAGLPLTLSAVLDTQVSEAQTYTLIEGQETTASDCLVINTDVSDLYASVSGQIVDINSDISGLKDGFYAYLFVGDRQIDDIYIDSDGTFQSGTFRRPDSGNIAFFISHQRSDVKDSHKTFQLDTHQSNTDIGIFEYRYTHVTGCLIDNAGNPYESSSYHGNIYVDDLFTHESFRVSTDDKGIFAFYLPSDDLEHAIYAVSDDRTLNANTSFIDNSPSIDLTHQCLQLELPNAVNMDLSLTGTHIDQVNFSVLYGYSEVESFTEYDGDYAYGYNTYFWSEEKVFDDLPAQTSLSLSKNGVYLLTINSAADIDAVFTSSFSARITIDGQVDQVINSPEIDYDGYIYIQSEFYLLQVTVFNGQAVVKPVNEFQSGGPY